MVSHDVMDTIKTLSKQDSSNDHYVWTIYGDYFVQVHSQLLDGNPGHCRASLERTHD